jgi:WhiB family redox-sensing transcriptional regulator
VNHDPLTASLDWRQRGACLDEDPELFFPVGTGRGAAPQEEEARAVCMRCPVRAECLAWALETGQEFGVWGGMTELDRRRIRRQQRRQPDPHREAARELARRFDTAAIAAAVRAVEGGNPDGLDGLSRAELHRATADLAGRHSARGAAELLRVSESTIHARRQSAREYATARRAG